MKAFILGTKYLSWIFLLLTAKNQLYFYKPKTKQKKGAMKGTKHDTCNKVASI